MASGMASTSKSLSVTEVLRDLQILKMHLMEARQMYTFVGVIGSVEVSC